MVELHRTAVEAGTEGEGAELATPKDMSSMDRRGGTRHSTCHWLLHQELLHNGDIRKGPVDHSI